MIENLKDVEKLLKLCRKQGVTELALPQISFKLGDLPLQVAESQEIDSDEVYRDISDEILTPEELTFFANGGKPEDNPYKKAL